MKINIIQKLKRPIFLSNLLPICLMLFFSSKQTVAQNLTKTFEKEVKVDDGATIIANVLEIENFPITTWDKPYVKQSIDVTIVPHKKTEVAQELLESLVIQLHEGGNRVNTDFDLGIESMIYTKKYCKIILKNKREFKIKDIKIKGSLYIPRNSNLNLKTISSNVTLGDLNGYLHLDMNSGDIRAGNVERLDAKLMFCKAYFKEIKEARLHTTSGEFHADKIELVNCTSAILGKYIISEIGDLEIENGSTNNFTIKKLGRLNAPRTDFCNFNIGNLKESLLINSINGDVTIDAVDNNFELIDITDGLSTVRLGLKPVENYLLTIFHSFHTKYQYPVGVTLLTKEDGYKEVYLKGTEDKAGKINIRCESSKVFFNGK